MSANQLPSYETPPVVEVAVSVQFEAPVLRGPTVMLRWSQIRDRFPRYEETPPVPSTIESFDGPQEPRIEFEISDAPPPSRLLMYSESESEVLQIQPNVFGYSWRRLGTEHQYPRYANIIEGFRREFDEFQEFLSQEQLGQVAPVQCEVTYVNIIRLDDDRDGFSDIGKIVPSVAPRVSDGFLPPPEEVRYASQYVIRGDGDLPLGRLFVSVEPGYLFGEETPSCVYLMKLTVRAAPQGTDIASVIGAMDIGHEWIVRGFTSMTSPDMHQAWRRLS